MKKYIEFIKEQADDNYYDWSGGVGKRVRIRDDSGYIYQAYGDGGNGYGEIISFSGHPNSSEAHAYRIKWNHGRTYNYRRKDFDFVDDLESKEDIVWWRDGKLEESRDILDTIIISDLESTFANYDEERFRLGDFQRYLGKILLNKLCRFPVWDLSPDNYEDEYKEGVVNRVRVICNDFDDGVYIQLNVYALTDPSGLKKTKTYNIINYLPIYVLGPEKEDIVWWKDGKLEESVDPITGHSMKITVQGDYSGFIDRLIDNMSLIVQKRTTKSLRIKSINGYINKETFIGRKRYFDTYLEIDMINKDYIVAEYKKISDCITIRINDVIVYDMVSRFFDNEVLIDKILSEYKKYLKNKSFKINNY